jgi:hypothetical protein
MTSGTDLDVHETKNDDLAAQVSRLDKKLEELAAAIERCRKVDLASKAMLAAGGAFVVLMALGMIRPEPVAVVGTIALLVGGTVIFGSNASTWTQAAAEMKTTETLMRGLIDRADLTLVVDRTSSRRQELG